MIERQCEKIHNGPVLTYLQFFVPNCGGLCWLELYIREEGAVMDFTDSITM